MVSRKASHKAQHGWAATAENHIQLVGDKFPETWQLDNNGKLCVLRCFSAHHGYKAWLFVSLNNNYTILDILIIC